MMVGKRKQQGFHKKSTSLNDYCILLSSYPKFQDIHWIQEESLLLLLSSTFMQDT